MSLGDTGHHALLFAPATCGCHLAYVLLPGCRGINNRNKKNAVFEALRRSTAHHGEITDLFFQYRFSTLSFKECEPVPEFIYGRFAIVQCRKTSFPIAFWIFSFSIHSMVRNCCCTELMPACKEVPTTCHEIKKPRISLGCVPANQCNHEPSG